MIVGTPDANIDQVSLDKLNESGKTVFDKLFKRLEEDRKARQD